MTVFAYSWTERGRNREFLECVAHVDRIVTSGSEGEIGKCTFDGIRCPTSQWLSRPPARFTGSH